MFMPNGTENGNKENEFNFVSIFIYFFFFKLVKKLSFFFFFFVSRKMILKIILKN
jgi:hypothetical protein